jgi:hypothetical protein
MKRLRLIVTVLLIVILGCDTSFNPKGPFRKQLVVYAILSTETDTTFARVYKTYDPPGFDPYEVTTDQPVTDAVVRLTSGGSEWVFGDTLVPRADTSRYQSDIAAYVLTGLSVTPGSAYQLNVQSPTAGSADAVVTVPGKGFLSVQNSFVLQNPTLTDDNIISTAALSSTTWGYLVRLFLIGEAWEAGAWRQFEREVPLSILEVIDCQTFISEYPRLQRREGSRSFEEHLQVFENNAYRWTIVSLRDGRDVDSVRFLRAEFEFLETDPHLYSYYNIASGFRDEFTLRTDEPDYSNIRDGRGIFGAFVRQRVVFNVPSDLGGSLSCQ